MKLLLLLFSLCQPLLALEGARILEVGKDGRTILISHGSFDNIVEGDFKTFFTDPDPYENRSYVLGEAEAIKVFSNYSYWDLTKVAASAQIVKGKKIYYSAISEIDLTKGEVLDFRNDEVNQKNSSLPIRNQTAPLPIGNVQPIEIFLTTTLNLVDHQTEQNEQANASSIFGGEFGLEYPLGNLSQFLYRFTFNFSYRVNNNAYGFDEFNLLTKEQSYRLGANWYPLLSSAKLAALHPYLGMRISSSSITAEEPETELTFNFDKRTHLSLCAGLKWRFYYKKKALMAVRAHFELERTALPNFLSLADASFIEEKQFTDIKAQLGFSYFF